MEDGQFQCLAREEREKLCEVFEANFEATQKKHQHWTPKEVFSHVWDSYEMKIRGDAISSLAVIALCQFKKYVETRDRRVLERSCVPQSKTYLETLAASKTRQLKGFERVKATTEEIPAHTMTDSEKNAEETEYTPCYAKPITGNPERPEDIVIKPLSFTSSRSDGMNLGEQDIYGTEEQLTGMEYNPFKLSERGQRMEKLTKETITKVVEDTAQDTVKTDMENENILRRKHDPLPLPSQMEVDEDEEYIRRLRSRREPDMSEYLVDYQAKSPPREKNNAKTVTKRKDVQSAQLSREDVLSSVPSTSAGPDKFQIELALAKAESMRAEITSKTEDRPHTPDPNASTVVPSPDMFPDLQETEKTEETVATPTNKRKIKDLTSKAKSSVARREQRLLQTFQEEDEADMAEAEEEASDSGSDLPPGLKGMFSEKPAGMSREDYSRVLYHEIMDMPYVTSTRVPIPILNYFPDPEHLTERENTLMTSKIVSKFN